MLEQLIAYHCGPALAGIKPANIVVCCKERIPEVQEQVVRLNKELNSRDIYIEILCGCDRRVMLMVYRKKVLEKQLQNADIRAFLADFGYPKDFRNGQDIRFLKDRLDGEEFPHEIGAFLGYPLHDIYGFMYHKDEGCILTGDWKVYENAEEAKKLFYRYKACRAALIKRVSSGKTLAQIFCAA